MQGCGAGGQTAGLIPEPVSARVFQRILYLTVYDVETTDGFSGLWDIRKKGKSMSNDEVLLNEDQLIESSLEDSSALT
jgi:hypothetical protein